MVRHQAYMVSNQDPRSVEEALTCSQREKWKAAMDKEYDALIQNQVWDLTGLPEAKKAIKSKCVFKTKTDDTGKVVDYKARLVAKGCSQKYGTDFNETFSPVTRYSKIRTLLCLGLQLGMDIDHLDVTTAFLNGELKEEVYLEQPEGYILGKNKVCKLKRAIYGLKQASRVWYEKIHSILLNLDFNPLICTPCVYSKTKGDTKLIVCVYVDDILLLSNNCVDKLKLKKQLASKLSIKDLGDVKMILGIRVIRDKDKLYLDQKNYIEQVLCKFNMYDCKPVTTPNAVGTQLNPAVATDDRPYRELVGCLNYLSSCTRPDITHTISYLSKFNNSHCEEHWFAAKRVLSYLKGTMDYCLTYIKSNLEITGYVDADFASDTLDRRSYSGYAFLLGNGAVAWESKKTSDGMSFDL